jgi:hypothetical protein
VEAEEMFVEGGRFGVHKGELKSSSYLIAPLGYTCEQDRFVMSASGVTNSGYESQYNCEKWGNAG